MSARGMGLVYLRGKVWWVQYSHRTKTWRESSGSTVKADATRLLKRRLSEVGKGRLHGPDAERTTLEDLAQLMFNDYQLNERKSLPRARQLVAHLLDYFGNARAVDITPDRASAYMAHRQEAGAKAATIRNEVAALGRMFTLAYRAGKVAVRPPFPSIMVRNTRGGFFEDGEFYAVLEHLPAYLQPFVEFAYLTGWRRGELRTLTWRQVDFDAETVRLEPGTTKNDEGRVFPFGVLPKLTALLIAQRERTSALERATGSVVPWVFHRDGKQVGDYRDSWQTACRKAGVPGRLVHDLRRTAVRRLERAGVPRSVAMKLTGHKTESIYRRYAIVSESDLAAGVQKLAALGGYSGAPSRKVVGISEGLAPRTSTVVAQSGDSAREVRSPAMPQALGNSGRLPLGTRAEVWRPQRDSNPEPPIREEDTNGE